MKSLLSPRFLRFLAAPMALPLLLACSPKVYLIDRQTVLEEEAAGEWPDFEKLLIEKATKKGPTPFAKSDVQANQSRIYNVLNGELGGQ